MSDLRLQESRAGFFLTHLLKLPIKDWEMIAHITELCRDLVTPPRTRMTADELHALVRKASNDLRDFYGIRAD